MGETAMLPVIAKSGSSGDPLLEWRSCRQIQCRLAILRNRDRTCRLTSRGGARGELLSYRGYARKARDMHFTGDELVFH
jgi:hypothetical protein